MASVYEAFSLSAASLFVLAALGLGNGCAPEPDGTADVPPVSAPADSKERIPVWSARVVHTYPHDPEAFTQGLEYSGGYLYESTGRQGQSTLRKEVLESGKAVRTIPLPAQDFGEGLTIFRGRIYQLTWLSKKGYIYDLQSLRPVGEFSYEWEGWGLAHDESSLIVSDGSNRLRFLDPASWKVTRTIEVYANGEAVPNLNELEYIDGQIFANIWHARKIAKIDPHSGQVLAWIDLSELAAKEENAEENVLNGIAYDPATKKTFVTGKNWAHLFEIAVNSEAKPN